ncbi:MAG TPA: carbon monoxide dehydrogenase [Bacteroidales bacterium]|nr:carbon monoxide dehydrogenase [Bacteroidales bacterium]
MKTPKKEYTYRELVSPESISDKAHPEANKAIVDEQDVDDEIALQEIALKALNAKKPVIVSSARIMMWSFDEGTWEKARVIRKLADAIGAEILPIFDTRPEFPTVKSAVEINPFHGDLVIEHNKYDVAIFCGIDCPYADVALKIIRAGSGIYTIALCGNMGHIDASITLRDATIDKLNKLIAIIGEIKAKGTH